MISPHLISVRVREWARRAFTLDARSLAVFRMAIGGIVCADALLRTRDFWLMFAPDGMFPLDVLQRYHGDRCIWSLAFLSDTAGWNACVLVLEGTAGALLAVGVWTQLATITAWVAVVSVVHRTTPATNAGDLWLTCLLFWSMFLPLGSTWSLDHKRARMSGQPGVCGGIFSPASAALVLQIAAVYFSAGLSKLNHSWLSGDALVYALSVHDHGTRLGQMLVSFVWIVVPATWAVVGLEICGPCLLLAIASAPLRGWLVVLFITFHLLIMSTMTVGLFGFIGVAAWLAIIPAAAWDRLLSRAATPSSIFSANCGLPAEPQARMGPGRRCRLLGSMLGQRFCILAGGLALVGLLYANTPWQSVPLARPLAAALHLTSLWQDWPMFGEVIRQEQWVYAAAELADGRKVDVLRGGRPLETIRPTNGFLSLPHHRWHKLFWELPRLRQRVFAPSVAAAIARHWNATHNAHEQIRTLEIRFTKWSDTPADDSLQEFLIATWPPRDPVGSGNLDRLLDEDLSRSHLRSTLD